MCCAFQGKEGGLSRRLSLGFWGPNSPSSVGQFTLYFVLQGGTLPSIPEKRPSGMVESCNAFVLLMEKLRNKMLKSLEEKRVGSRVRVEPERLASCLVFRKLHFKQRSEHWSQGSLLPSERTKAVSPSASNTSPLIRSNHKKEQTHLFCLQWLAKFQTKPDPSHFGPNPQYRVYQGVCSSL